MRHSDRTDEGNAGNQLLLTRLCQYAGSRVKVILKVREIIVELVEDVKLLHRNSFHFVFYNSSTSHLSDLLIPFFLHLIFTYKNGHLGLNSLFLSRFGGSITKMNIPASIKTLHLFSYGV